MIHLILVLAIVGFIVWLILLIPMPAVFRNIIVGIVAIFAVIWALQMLGVNTGFPRIGLR
jgi:hypothetical protein